MIEILKETARYLVCVKPIGIAAQGTQAEAMPQLLSEQLGCDIFPVHRLDQTVGGIMVYAKTVQEAARLTQAMGQGQMQKTYLAVLTGCPAEKAGTLEDLLFHDRVKNKTYVVKRMRGGVKQAKLHYEILARQDGLSLVRIRLETGRTHQIRVQFASRGLPLLGDGKYGTNEFNRKYRVKTQALCAYKLSFKSDAELGALEYLAGKEFMIDDIWFVDKFFK
mgnify:CR=1 FL=1